jgi:hypothetical protein
MRWCSWEVAFFGGGGAIQWCDQIGVRGNMKRECPEQKLSGCRYITRDSVDFERKRQQESSSFLKQRTKKLLLAWFTRQARSVRTYENKSFLALFFKTELLAFVTQVEAGPRNAHR